MKNINFIFKTPGWGGNEIMAIKIASVLKDIGCDVKIYCKKDYFDKFMSICNIDLYDVNNYVDTRAVSIYVAPSFWHAIRIISMKELLSKKSWIYAPFVGAEWEKNKYLRRVRLFIVKLYFNYLGAKSIGIKENYLELITKKNKVFFPNVPINFARAINDGKNNCLRLICAGRVDFDQKAQNFLLDEFLRAKCFGLLNEVELFFIGDGPDLEKLKVKANFHESVKFFGWGNVEKFYNTNSILIIPSHYEGLPLVGLEALISGVPVIGTVGSGLSGIIKNECIFDGNCKSLCGCIDYVLNNKKECIDFSVNIIKEKYSKEFLENSIRIWLKGV